MGKVPEYGGRGAPPNFLNQEKTGNTRKLIKKRKGGKIESVQIKISMEIQKK